MPATSSALLLTHMPWKSRFVSAAGRSEHDRVELLAGGEAAREVAHRPAAAEHPVAVGVAAGVGADRGAGLRAPRDVVQGALGHAVTRLGGVAVGVEKPGSEHAALQVDARVLGPRCAADRRGRPTATMRPSLTATAEASWRDALDGVDDAVLEDQVCGHSAVSGRSPDEAALHASGDGHDLAAEVPGGPSDARNTIDAAQSSGVATLRNG